MFSNTKVVTFVVVSLTCLAIVAGWDMMGAPGAVAPLLLLAMLALVSHPSKLLLLLWIATVSAPALEVLLPGVLIKSLEQILAIAVLALILGDVALRRKSPPGLSVFLKCMIGLGIVTLLSTYANRAPVKAVFFFVVTYFKPFWIFYFVLRFMGSKYNHRILAAITITMVVQVILNGLTYAGLNPVPARMGRTWVDWSMGTFGSAAYMAYYVGAVLCVLFARTFSTKSKAEQLKAATLSLLAGVQLVFCYAIHFYPVLVGSLFFQYLFMFKRKIRYVLPITLIGGFVVAMIVFLAIRAPLRETTTEIVSLPRMHRRLTELQRGVKAISYKEVFLKAGNHLDYPLLGGGPGNYTSRIALLLQRPKAMLPHLFSVYSWTAVQQIKWRGSVITTPRTGYIALWGDLGPFGFLLFWGLHVYAALRVYRLYKRGAYSERASFILAQAFVPVMAMFLVINVIRDIAVDPPFTVGLWIWAATVWNPDSRLSEESEDRGDVVET